MLRASSLGPQPIRRLGQIFVRATPIISPEAKSTCLSPVVLRAKAIATRAGGDGRKPFSVQHVTADETTPTFSRELPRHVSGPSWTETVAASPKALSARFITSDETTPSIPRQLPRHTFGPRLATSPAVRRQIPNLIKFLKGRKLVVIRGVEKPFIVKVSQASGRVRVRVRIRNVGRSVGHAVQYRRDPVSGMIHFGLKSGSQRVSKPTNSSLDPCPSQILGFNHQVVRGLPTQVADFTNVTKTGRGLTQLSDTMSESTKDGHKFVMRRSTHPQCPQREAEEHKPATTMKGDTKDVDPITCERIRLHRVVQSSSSPSEAWDAYQALIALLNDAVPPNYSTAVSLRDLHRLARLLTSVKPRTRTTFLRLLDVLARIRSNGGKICLYEWNALINLAGKGWRKTRTEDYQTALGVYNDMVAVSREAMSNRRLGYVKPDIVTYTTLLNIAARTCNPALLRHSLSLLHESGLKPNRITNLVLLRYRAGRDKLHGIRESLLAMNDSGQSLSVDGINAVLVEYVRMGLFDVPMRVYEVLRQNSMQVAETTDRPIHHNPPGSAAEIKAQGMVNCMDGQDVDGICIPEGMRPNQITYTIMIQGLAYHGHLMPALEVWADMLSLPKPSKPDKGTTEYYTPTLAVLRAIFCGFARHGQSNTNVPRTSRMYTKSHWNADNLSAMLDGFFSLPAGVNPSERTIYWIMVAVGKTSGNDKEKMRAVWRRIEERYPRVWGGRLKKIAKVFGGDVQRSSMTCTTHQRNGISEVHVMHDCK